MKLSRFNAVIPTESEGEYLLANMMSGAVSAIDEELKTLLENGDITALDSSTIHTLCRLGVVISDDTDEDRTFKVEFERRKYAVNSLNFALITTYSCNLACQYCYQGKGNLFHGTMTEDTRNRAISFIGNKMETVHPKVLSLALYGGEPLLDFQNALSIMEFSHKIAEENDVTFFCVLITNGTLVTPFAAEALSKYNTKHVQITLDGPKSIHDKRRIYKKGGGTFEDILKSVHILEDSGLSVYFRINVDEETRPHLGELFDELREEGLAHVEVYCSRVAPSQAGHAYSRCIARKDFLTVLAEFRHLAELKGQPAIARKLYPSYLPCGFLSEGAYVIDPHADVYKCLTFVGQKKHSVGHISPEGEIQHYTSEYYDWMSRDPLLIPECSHCTMLPSCGGGCAAAAYETYKTYHAPGCSQPSAEIENRLTWYLEQKFPDDFKKGKIIWD